MSEEDLSNRVFKHVSPEEMDACDFLAPHIGEKLAWAFYRAGIKTVADLRTRNSADIQTFGGIGKKRCQKILSLVDDFYATLEPSEDNVIRVDFTRREQHFA